MVIGSREKFINNIILQQCATEIFKNKLAAFKSKIV